MRPKFSQSTPAEQQNFGNGVGPDWIPKWAREVATAWLCFFFASASWRHHDFGYDVGGDRWDRRRCDDKFLIAMRRDALSLPALQFWAIPLALMIAYSTYFLVRIFGDYGSFKHRDAYATLDEIQSLLEEPSRNQ